MTSTKRAEEVASYAAANGDAAAMKEYDINVGSLARYKAMARGSKWQPSAALRTIAEKYSPAELRALADGAALGHPIVTHPPIEFDGDHVKFGFLTDTHFGSLYTPVEFFDAALQEFDKADCTFAVHAGDLCEGMSNRAGHIYELSHIGYRAQRDYAVEQMAKWGKPWYVIDGNHDRWFIKTVDAHVVEDVCSFVPRMDFLGHDVGELPLAGGARITLWHGEDGASYATSYRLQKIVEGLAGGTKPNVLLCGHSHKQGFFFERNIHVISGGSIQVQTPWMRGKRYPAHPGFWIIDLWIANGGVAKIAPCWHPFYA